MFCMEKKGIGQVFLLGIDDDCPICAENPPFNAVVTLFKPCREGTKLQGLKNAKDGAAWTPLYLGFSGRAAQ